MNLNIKYFGMLAEITKCETETLLFSETTIAELLEVLYTKYPLLENKNFQIAQHKKIVNKSTLITETEIALLPPFAGG